MIVLCALPGYGVGEYEQFCGKNINFIRLCPRDFKIRTGGNPGGRRKLRDRGKNSGIRAPKT